MAAKVPRLRKLGSLAYVKNNFSEMLSPNLFPQLIYSFLFFRLSGSITTGAGALGTAVAENPYTLIKSIQVKIAGTDFIDIPATDLRILAHYIGQRPGVAPTSTAVANTASATQSFKADLMLPFSLTDMHFSGRRRGFFASNRYPTVSLRINWGSEEDLIAAGGYATKAVDAGCVLDVWAEEWSQEPAFESASNLLLHKRGQQTVDANGVVLTNYSIELPRDPSLLRGVLIKQFTDVPETPITTLFTALKAITLRYGKTDRKLEFDYETLQRINTRDYGIALPNGYVFLDLAPDGDFARLQDTTSGVFELLVDSASVANAKIRTTFVRYGASN
jgi:hypothetical protein